MELIDLQMSREYFDRLVKEGILTPKTCTVLEVHKDAGASREYVRLMNELSDAYDEKAAFLKSHKEKIKAIWEQLEEIKHGKKATE